MHKHIKYSDIAFTGYVIKCTIERKPTTSPW